MCSLLFSFPQDIFYLFANYLLVEDDQNKKVFHFSYDWRNFMNTSKEYLTAWKKECQIITLTWKFAERFEKSSDFRSRILQTIQNPRLQLELSFVLPDDEFRHPVVNLSKVNGVRKLSLQECKLRKIELLDVEELVLDCCKVTDLSFCANVKELTYGNSEGPLTLDVSCLSSLEKFDLQHEEPIIVNLESLANLKKVHFLMNQHLSDVSCLRNVPDLSFAHCHAIKDVGCLANVYELKLFRCRGIRNVSSLGHVHKLNLKECENIRDVSALGNVHTLDLSGCNKVKDISALINVHSLTFQYFQGTDLSGLRNVVFLDISDSPNIRDISRLTKVRTLHISKCPKIHDFTGLHNLKELIGFHPLVVNKGMQIIQQLQTLRVGEGCFLLSGTRDTKPTNTAIISNIYLSELTNLTTLELLRCTSLTEFSSTSTKLRSLIINSCYDLVSIPTLPPLLGHLRIYNCSSLKGLVLTGNDISPLYRVEVLRCDAVKKIEIHRKVFYMTLERCDRLKRMEITTQIDRLRVNECCDLRSIVGLKKIISLLDEDIVEICEEDPADPGEAEAEEDEDRDSEEDDDEDEDEDEEDDENDEDAEDWEDADDA
jgi:hypothetical protein